MSFINRNYRDSIDIYVTLSAESTDVAFAIFIAITRTIFVYIHNCSGSNDVSKKALKVAHEENYRIFLFFLHKTHSLPFLVKMSIYHYDTPEEAKVLYLFVLSPLFFVIQFKIPSYYSATVCRIHIYFYSRGKKYIDLQIF